MARSFGLALILLALIASGASAASLEPVGAFDKPIFVTSDPTDPDRLLVVERDGRVAEVDGPGASPQLHADLTGLVTCCAGERGLLSIAPAPDFGESGLFYAAYTGEAAAGGAEGDIHVDAFVAGEAGAVARMPIISIPHGQLTNHNGGQIQLGPDGNLYISTGDGGGAGDPSESGQSLTSLLGKVLRIDPSPGAMPAYSIPPGNPFAGTTAGADEIWAYGLRNPWRFSFDSLSGDLLVADVGQAQREEVNHAVSPSPGAVGGAGANYGWSCREGFLAYTDATPSANCVGVGGFTDPVFDYPHTDPDPPADRAYGCSITGGYVVRDPSLGDLYGRYVYADYCIGEVRSLLLPAGVLPARDDRAEPLGTPTPNPTSFGEDSCHRLYVASGSTVFRFVGALPADCSKAGEEPPKEGSPPPGGGPAPDQPSPPTSTPSVTTEGTAPLPAVGFRLAATRSGRRLLVSVEVGPCERWRGRIAQLNRGGRRVGRKRVDDDCALVFPTGLRRPATFRALVEAEDGTAYRSGRLSLR